MEKDLYNGLVLRVSLPRPVHCSHTSLANNAPERIGTQFFSDQSFSIHSDLPLIAAYRHIFILLHLETMLANLDNLPANEASLLLYESGKLQGRSYTICHLNAKKISLLRENPMVVS